MQQHPWHGVSPGKDVPDLVNGIIEIPQGSRAKYELDKESGLIKLDRVLYSAVYYPINYGFIPRSLGEDKDPLDIVVLSRIDLVPLCLVETKVIGVMRMLDNGEADDKIIAVAAHDISVNHIDNVKDIPAAFRRELTNFFEDYKKLENKSVLVEDIQDKELAAEIIIGSLQRYQETFPQYM